MNKNSLYDLLRLFLKNSLDADMANLYYRMFDKKLISQDRLETVLHIIFTEYKNGNKEWFGVFHKLIRKSDFYSEYQLVAKIPIVMDEQEKKEYDELKRWTNDEISKAFSDIDEETISLRDFQERTDRFKREGAPEGKLYNEKYRRYLKLNTKSRASNEVSISGIIDMFLHTIIDVDKEDVLFTAMEQSFKLYEEPVNA